MSFTQHSDQAICYQCGWTCDMGDQIEHKCNRTELVGFNSIETVFLEVAGDSNSGVAGPAMETESVIPPYVPPTGRPMGGTMVLEDSGISADHGCSAPGVPPMNPETPVGDLNSAERGSGARMNSGKPALELIPVALFTAMHENPINQADEPAHIISILSALAEFQEGEDPAIFDCLRACSPNLEDAAAVFDYGRHKYAEWNWAKGMHWSIPIACILRHFRALLAGEANDPESGLPHIGHVVCNVVMLAHFTECYPEGDDRPNSEWFTRSTPFETTSANTPTHSGFTEEDMSNIKSVMRREIERNIRHRHPTR